MKILSYLLVFFCFVWCRDDPRNEQLNKEYIYVPRDSSFYGVVDTHFVYIGGSPKGGLYTTMVDGYKFKAIRNSYPKELSGYVDMDTLYLDNFLKKGDTIFKPAERDSLYVLKYGQRFGYFLPTKEFHDSIFAKKSFWDIKRSF